VDPGKGLKLASPDHLYCNSGVTRYNGGSTYRLGSASLVNEDSSAQRDRGIRPIDTGSTGFDGVYIISVAARILEMHPQTLRKYERAGLVTPSRTGGMLRLYSEEDIARLRLIKHLVGDLGLNVAGVQLVLQVFNNLLETRVELRAVDDDDLRGFTVQTLDRMFELLHAHTR
jgi:MerR family transcriptional regulator/heat shock protein HspR